MPPDRHPDHHSHDGQPVTHHHREHAISNDDRYDRGPSTLYGADGHAIQPVTVSDLLDAHNKWTALGHLGDSDEWDAYQALCARASYDQYRSLERILTAQRASTIRDERLAVLSPEERAEFDRRTT